MSEELLSKVEEEQLKRPKKGLFRVKRFASKKEVIVTTGWNGNTSVHSVFEANVNANDPDEAIKIAMLFFPIAFGATYTWTVQTRSWGPEDQRPAYASTQFKESDIASLLFT